ncbi:MAG: DUF1622 domain-containing protein [Candidatus Peribacteraceae bacterium]|jgi:uncharacterized membrane protein
MSPLALFAQALVENLESLSILIASLLGYVGVVIIFYGGLKGFVYFIHACLYPRQGHVPLIRIELAKYLSLGLEFLVGRDVIGTIVHPTWDELGKLIIIVLLRTAVSLFLDYELRKLHRDMEEYDFVSPLLAHHPVRKKQE